MAIYRVLADGEAVEHTQCGTKIRKIAAEWKRTGAMVVIQKNEFMRQEGSAWNRTFKLEWVVMLLNKQQPKIMAEGWEDISMKLESTNKTKAMMEQMSFQIEELKTELAKMRNGGG